ncbi:hypothetical protein Sango_0613900 [Sesamum angolense]|uniref:Uncharacterized protein n=1 Tax=Sesamum angolense TaxID=2727404 RepID=A0AAE1X691_9LAMI|nr:hypothetical protein Sango_0613900 [Sesamum angolense]
MTGKKCCMVGARDLKILLADSPQNWKWRFDADSRFSEVAELRSVLRLDIQAKINAQMLQPRTLEMQLNEPGAYLQLVKDTKGGNVVGRADGWTEVEMGNFYVGKGDDGEVEARLLEFRR